MSRSSRLKKEVKPLNTLIQTVPAERAPMPTAKDLLLATQQPKDKPDPAVIEQEIQALRHGTHPGFLRALDDLDAVAQEQVLAVRRLKDDRQWNVEQMFIAEMQSVDDEYKDHAEALREKMIEELVAKSKEIGGKSDVVTRGKRKAATKDDKPKKKQNTFKGVRHAIASDEISTDLEQIRQQLHGVGGGTRSKAKL